MNKYNAVYFEGRESKYSAAVAPPLPRRPLEIEPKLCIMTKYNRRSDAKTRQAILLMFRFHLFLKIVLSFAFVFTLFTLSTWEDSTAFPFYELPHILCTNFSPFSPTSSKPSQTISKVHLTKKLTKIQF